MKAQNHLNRLRSEISKARFYEVLFTFILNFIRGFSVLLVLDYLVHIDHHLFRILLLMGVVIWSYRDVRAKRKHPIHHQLSDAELIRVFERKYPQLEGRWIASLQLAHLRSHPAVAQINRETEELAQQISASDELVNWGPLSTLRKNALTWLVVFVLAIAVIGPLRLAFKRVFVDTPWPLLNQLDLSQVQKVVPRGESFRLVVKPQEGQETASETIVTIIQGGDEIQSLPMLENRQGELFALVDGVNEDVHLVFKGGDFESEKVLVSAVDRPRIENADVVGQYPDYIDLPDKKFETEGYSYSFVQQGTLSIVLHANKPLRKAVLVTERATIDMALEETKAIAEVPLESNGDWIVKLIGEHDFENKSPLHMLVEALADQPPQVNYFRPKKDLNLCPNAYIEIDGLIEDDFGVERTEIMTDRVDLEQQRTVNTVTLDATKNKNVTKNNFGHMIDFATLGVQPGEVFKFQVQGNDFLGQQGVGRQIAIHIVHEETINEEIDSHLKEIKKILEKMVARESKVIELTNGLAAVVPNLPVQIMSLTLEKQNSLEALSIEVFDLMDNVDQLVKLNRLKRDDVVQMLMTIAEGLNRFKDHELKEAVKALMTLRETRAGADKAIEAEKVCLQTLQSLIEIMGGAQGYIEIIQNVEKVIHQEKEIRDATKRISE